MSSTYQSMQVKLASPPKFKKGYVYVTWESEFRSFVERASPDILKMYTEEGYNSLPTKEVAESMALQQFTGSPEELNNYKIKIKLNNEAQLLLRSAMDKSTNLIRVLEHQFGDRATKIEDSGNKVPSAFHQKISLT